MRMLKTFQFVMMLFLVTNLSLNLSAQEATSCQNKAFLGVVMADDMSENQGVKVADVVEKSAAAELGLQEGDLITSINNTKVTNADELIAAMKKQAVGDKIGVAFVRDGKPQKAMATLKTRPERNESSCSKGKNFGHHYQKMHDPNKGFLGVHLGIKQEETVENEKSTVTTTVVLEKVIEDGAAAKAGLQQGDIITKINGQSVDNPSFIQEQLQDAKVGDMVSFAYLRSDVKGTANVTLEEKPESFKNFHGKSMQHFNKGEFDCKKNKSCDKANNNKVLLGVFSEATNADVIENYELRKVKAGEGVFIKEVIEGSAAEDAGLQVADVILKIGKAKVNTTKGLVAALASYKVGDSETVSYIRNGKKAKTTVTFKANKANCDWKKDCNKSKCKPSDCQKKIEKIIKIDGDNIEEWVEEMGENGEELQFNLNEMLETLGENNEELKKHLEDIDIDIENALQNIEGDIRIFKGDIENFDMENFNLNEMLDNLGVDVQIFEEESEEDGRMTKKIIIIQDDENATGKVRITEPAAEDMEMMENILKQKAETSQKTMATSLESVKDINFYPNPNDGKFILKFDVPKEVATTIRIIDTKGQSVYEQELPAFVGQYHQEIDISERTTGLYLLQIVQGNEVMMRKILIQ